MQLDIKRNLWGWTYLDTWKCK